MSEISDSPVPIFSIRRATAIIAVFTLLSRIMGLLRDSILASSFGISSVMDSYSAAFRVPDFLFNIFIIGTLSVAFLPIFNREMVRNISDAKKLTNSIFGISVSFIFLFSAILFIFAPTFVKLIVPGFSGVELENTIMFTRIMLFSPVFFTISTIASVLLQSYNKFWPTAVAPIFYNLGIVIGATFFVDIFGIIGLPIGVVFGAMMHTMIQTLNLKSIGMKLSFSFNVKLESVKEVWKMYLPRLLFLDLGQVSLLISSIVGSFLATGSIAAYYYASNLQAVPMGIFALSFAVACFPLLSRSWASKEFPEFKSIVSKAIIQILFFIIPLSGLIIILRAQIVRVVLGHGHLDWIGTILTAQTLGILSLSLFAQSLIPLLARAFYATYNTKIPVITGLLSGITNVILAIILSKEYGVLGIAIATSIASILNLLLLSVSLRIHIGKFYDPKVYESLLKILISSAFAITTSYATLYAIAPAVNMTKTTGVFIQGFISGINGIIIYLIVGLLLNLKESRDIYIVVKNFFSKYDTR